MTAFLRPDGSMRQTHAAALGWREGIRHKAVILAEIDHVRAVFAIIILAAAPAVAAAQNVPLPRPRPTQAATAVPTQAPKPEELAPLSACRLRLSTLAVATSLPPLVGTGECGVDDVVQLEAVLLPDKTRVAV